MLGGRRAIRSVFGALVLALAGLMPVAAETKITLFENTDLPGFDYSIVKNTDLDSCQQECSEDNICRAFTYNSRSEWCFLKGDIGDRAEFAGATSGRVSRSPTPAVTEAVRQAELPFPAQSLVDSAKGFARDLPQTDAPAPKSIYADLVASGDEEVANENYQAAMVAYRQALAINANDRAVWQALAEAALRRADVVAGQSEGDNSYDLSYVGSNAAMNAFLRSTSEDERASSLRALANAMEYREMWREVIATYRAALALVPDADVEAHLDSVVAQHGFRVTDHVVDAEAASPRICVVFSEPLGSTDLSAYVSVANAPQVSVETESEQICVEGVQYGNRYTIKLRAGLASANGEELRKDVDLSVYVPDRAPFVGFANNAYVMPAGLGGGLPITSVNAETAEVMIYRIGDRGIATAVRDGVFQGSLSQYNAEDIADRVGEQVWTGEVDLAQGDNNALTTTAIPVAEALGTLEAGAYVITARIKGEPEDDYWSDLATQWFIVTDLGVTTIAGDDGVHAFVRSLATAQPVAGADVRLVAVNNEILGEATTDADGRAVFAPGLARGTGGRAPQLLVAETEGDYAFLDLSKPAFDLTDRGVEGRPSPGPLDLFMTTERGVYRPGEVVHLTALLRDARAEAVENLPLTLEVERPDGVVASSQVMDDEGAGGYYAALPMASEAMRGSWTLRLYSDPNADALSSTTFLVEDFEPERLAFEIKPQGEGAFSATDVNLIDIAAKYLYGATAPGLSVEADAIVRPRTTLPEFPGFTFGRLDDTIETTREPLGTVGVTDDDGNAVAEVTLPEGQATTRPLEAQVLLRLVDTSGRTVERSITRPVLADGDRIGIKPVFADATGLEEGSEAQFELIVVSPEGEKVAATGLGWTLSRVETNYQWYRNGSTWQWEGITTTREIANGEADTPDGGSVTVGANVNWGLYRLRGRRAGHLVEL
ncbi:alpha-2-macroglobulin family protein [Devosia riboflavina]